MSARFRRRGSCVALLLALIASAGCSTSLERGREPGVASAARANDDAPRAWWPSWRGPEHRGIARQADPPVDWSQSSGVRWSVELPGQGHASPVIHGDRLFVTYAEPFGESREHADHDHPDGAHDNVTALRRLRLGVVALDRRDGELLWRSVVREVTPHEGMHVTASWASASPATDGRALYASFGSHGLFALDVVDGAVLWQAELGPMQIRHGHGEGSTPALHGDTLVVQHDHEGDSFLAAFATADGEQRWRVPRVEGTSWSTPLIIGPTADGLDRAIVVTAATPFVRGYDLADGRELWRVEGLSRNVVATPVSADGRLFAANSYDTRAMLAINLADVGRADSQVDPVAWRRSRDTPYVPSPVLLDDALCFLKHLHPVLTCVDPRDGRTTLGPWRVPGLGRVFASPVAAAGRLYLSDRDGVTVVVEPRAVPQVLARNELDDSFSASAAIAGDAIYLRGERALWCLGRVNPPGSP